MGSIDVTHMGIIKVFLHTASNFYATHMGNIKVFLYTTSNFYAIHMGIIKVFLYTTPNFYATHITCPHGYHKSFSLHYIKLLFTHMGNFKVTGYKNNTYQ